MPQPLAAARGVGGGMREAACASPSLPASVAACAMADGREGDGQGSDFVIEVEGERWI